MDAQARFVEDAGCHPDAAAAAFDAALDRYREARRAYHGVAHVRSVLRAIDGLLCTEACADPRSVRFAGLYHDVVYDPRSHDNEARSAAFAAVALRGLGVDEPTISEVGRLIMMTVDHHASTDDERVLADADLAVLGAAPEVYDAYVAGVRFEYGHVPDDQWRTGRAAVLERLLGRTRLYSTATGRVAEPMARANLARELAALTRSPPAARSGRYHW